MDTATIPIQRGVRLYNALLFNELDIVTLPKPEHSGRDPQLIENRNQFLFYRYYFKTAIQRKQYIDVCRELSNETFLSQIRIKEILQDNTESVLLLKKQKPQPKELAKLYPHINWH